MGGNFSMDYINHIIDQEYHRILGDKERDYLKLNEILMLRPPEEITIDFYHIGTLFILDEDKDGRFTKQELRRYAGFCHSKQKQYKQHEINSMLQASCTLKMWSSLCKEDGEDDFIAWIGRLLYENENVQYFNSKPGIPFIPSDTIFHLYEILNVKTTQGVEFQEFINLVQRAAEELDLMTIDDEQMDNYVPLTICQTFTRDFIRAFAKLMDQIGLTNKFRKL